MAPPPSNVLRRLKKGQEVVVAHRGTSLSSIVFYKCIISAGEVMNDDIPVKIVSKINSDEIMDGDGTIFWDNGQWWLGSWKM